MRSFIVLLAATLLATTVLAAAPTHSASARYGPADFVACGTAPINGIEPDAVCFGVREGDASVRVRIVDTTGLVIGWSYNLFGPSGENLANGMKCGEATLPIHIDAVSMTVKPMNTAHNVIFYCGAFGHGIPGGNTLGTVYADFFSA